MKYRKDLYKIFGGPGVIEKIFCYIEKGSISRDHVKGMADEMGVRDVYDQNSDKEPTEIVTEMLDKYYEKHLFKFCEKPHEGQEEFTKVLNEKTVGLSNLVISEITKEFAQSVPTEDEKHEDLREVNSEEELEFKKEEEEPGEAYDLVSTINVSGNGRKKVLIIGKTGVGKSSLCNVIAGKAHNDPLFPVSAASKSCTQNTKEILQNIYSPYLET